MKNEQQNISFNILHHVQLKHLYIYIKHTLNVQYLKLNHSRHKYYVKAI